MYDELPHSLMTDFRDEFKLLLEKSFVSGKGTDEEIYKGMMSFLNKVGPNIPERLFRYRKIDEKGYTLKAFKNGMVSACKPKCFSDKYDSLIFVDTEKQISEMREASKLALRKVLSDIKKHNPRLRAEKVSQICYYMEQGMSDNDIIDKIISETCSNFFIDVEKELKRRESRFRDSEKTARIACFTESVQSKFMWDTYAGGYRGFALEYDLRDFFIKNLHKGIPAYVFPVIYTDERPDLTLDESNYYTFQKMEEKGWLDKLEPFRPFLDFNLLSPHKPYLYKDKVDYGHEREWRLLYYNEESIEDYMEISDQGCLKAIYYGPDIKAEDYEILHQIAKNKGIDEYKVSIDNNSRKYSLKVSSI